MDRRNAILNGIRVASELHEKLGFKETLRSGIEYINVFQAISELDLPLLCKPLDGLLGAYQSKPVKGILVTTKMRLPIQRFTAAHELGHHMLGHEGSLDSEDSLSLARQGVKNCPIQEIEAEAFASEFLLPKWLLVSIIKRQGWGRADLKNPDTVYQLSLRMGVSYEATWVGMLTNNMIEKTTAEALKKVPPRNSKLAILEDIEPLNSWADAHFLTEKDNGSKILGSPEDTVVIELLEHTNGGYIWSGLENNDGLEFIRDERKRPEKGYVGEETKRKIAIRGKSLINLRLKECRQWENNAMPINNYEVTLDFSGKEIDLPRACRQ